MKTSTKLNKLTDQNYWNYIYNDMEINDLIKGKSHKLLKKLFKKNLYNLLVENYSTYLFWEICNKYLPKNEGLKILEVGSAPGINLIQFHKKFGYDPYGVEYSPEGVEINKKIFYINDIDQNNVIQSDFFSDEFQEKYNNSFDLVISRGFIEHFTDVNYVLEKHVHLLKNDGILIITIPRIRGMNYLLANYFAKGCLKRHNLEIMDKKIFSKIFENLNLSILYLEYFGTVNFGIIGVKNNPLKYNFLRLFYGIQLFLNLIFRSVLKNNSYENKYTSPNLICISKKI